MNEICNILQGEGAKYQHLSLKLQQLIQAHKEPNQRKRKLNAMNNYQRLELSVMEKQGIYLEHTRSQQRYDVALGDTLTKLVCIQPKPIHPHTDIEPTGRILISLQHIPRKTSPAHTDEIACIHLPDGSRPVTMPTEQLS